MGTRTGFRIRLDYGVPLIEIDGRDRQENAQDNGFYFSVGYGFLGNGEWGGRGIGNGEWGMGNI